VVGIVELTPSGFKAVSVAVLSNWRRDSQAHDAEIGGIAGNPTRINRVRGDRSSVDSAAKPQMVKKRQLKTPPKHSGHTEKIAHNQSWRVLYLTQFHGFW
jgi:hypothetical protein